MSKIEKALKVARERGTLMVPARPGNAEPAPVAASPSRALRPVPTATHDIARMREPGLLSNELRAAHGLISADMTDNRVANAYRELRTRLLQKLSGRNAVVMVTSAAVDRGASFVSANLAVALSLDESKTSLLVDCDLRDPYLNRLIDGAQGSGLTDYLQGRDIGVDRIIYPVGIPRMRLLPSGSLNRASAEYFTSLRMRELMDDITRRYPDRYVILNAPAIADSADAQILLELCDYVLLVVPYGRLTPAQVMKAAKAVGEQKLLGVIFNDEPAIPKFSWRRLGDILLHPFRSPGREAGNGATATATAPSGKT
jgi:protein-tyrosine kinase